jgi:hypothetical protein
MSKIYRHIPLSPDEVIGRIEDGKIYDEEDGENLYIGRIDYTEGAVYDDEDGYMGWLEGKREVYARYDDGEEAALGYVAEDGKLYLYDEEEDDHLYVGQVIDMTNPVEGAAALLFFFDEAMFIFDDDEEEEEEDE